jgi:hypothetical protein
LPPDAVHADAARRHLAALAAEPRPAGGPAETRAREYCARILRELGFVVREEPFAYSSFPGRFATPAAGVVYILLLAAAGHFGWRGSAAIALAVLVGGALVIGMAIRLAMRGVLDLPWARRTSVNLVAERGSPAVWLVAHLDSKSQPVPIGVRAAGITLMTLVMLGALATAALELAGLSVEEVWPWLLGIGALAAVPVALSVVGERSAGALDNASGVAAVLLAAELLPRDRAVGVLLTSAEELGLAGARAWARAHPPGLAINFDGLDDVGALRFWHGGAAPQRLLELLTTAAHGLADRPRIGSVPLGILVDGVALADGGWTVVTLSRGNWRTVARIHTPRDTVAHLTGGGVAEGATVAARAVDGLA